MVIAIFGESCTGKSTLAGLLQERLQATVYTGKDYLRLSRNADEARALFQRNLLEAREPLIYVISEREHLALLPPDCLRILVTAELDIIKERFARRMGGKLPPPVAMMLEKKHGLFDDVPHDLHVDGRDGALPGVCAEVLAWLEKCVRAGDT